MIAAYLHRGEVLAAWLGGDVVGHAQLLRRQEAGDWALNSMAVAEGRQRQGVGRRLVAAAVRRCRAAGARRLIVSTAAADIGNLRFYQRQGFRMHRIVQDAFGPESGYPDGLVIDGIPLRDRVDMELVLT